MPPGTRLGPYEIIDKLGAGGMGEVYRARDTRLNRDVAIKVLPGSLASDPDRLRRFEQEARATGMLNHPNILAVYDVGTHEGVPYLVTELLEGETLRDGLPVPRRKSLDYARQIATGLAAAHSKGITHRDLKPENLFITHDGRVKILDFGLAKLEVPEADGDVTRTAGTTPGIAMGTVGYMSPEQARGKPADHRSDIFSFGAILYEMLGGTRAFQRDSAMDTISAILKEDPPPLADHALDAVVRRCIEKSPEQRFQSASDLGFAIEALSGALSGSVITQAVASAAPRGRAWAAIALAAVLALAFGIAGGFGGGAWWRARKDAVAPPWKGLQLTGSGIAYAPRVSPDGSTLAFVVVEGSSSQIAVMHPGSANWTILTREKSRGEIESLCWSRDGTRIYYGRRTGVYSIPVLGGDERLILEQAKNPEILPDGSMLVTRLNSNRQTQLHHYWPETGRIEPIDFEVLPRFRPSPDGRQVVFIGRRLSDPKSTYDLHVLDLSSGKSQTFGEHMHLSTSAMTFSADGKAVVAIVTAGDLMQIAEIPLDAHAPVRTLFTLSSPVWFLDLGSDGSVYVDQVRRPLDVLRFPVTGGVPERAAEAVRGGAPIPLGDGRIAFVASVANRATLLVTQTDKSPVPLVDSEEDTDAPVARLGKDRIAFMIGKVGDYGSRQIGIATVADGRIVQRLESTRGIGISSMTASPDGSTIYYTSSGSIWAVNAGGGAPRKIGSADSVVAFPNGKELMVLREEKDGQKLYRLTLGGGEAPIPFSSEYLLNQAISPGAIRADGKIAITVIRPDSWWDEIGILDPATGKVDKLTVPYVGDEFAPAWTEDGRLVCTGFQMQGSVWRFRK
jgi:Tol biopolymer transport system component